MRFNKKIFSFFLLSSFVLSSSLLMSCNKQPVGPTGPDPAGPFDPTMYMTLAEFRALYTGTDYSIPTGTKKIRGVVVSNSANEAAGNYRLQDESGSGIYLYSVAGSPIYPIGALLEIDATGGGILTKYKGDLELKSVPMANVIQKSGTIAVTPRVTTCAAVVTNRDAWASSLVTINNLTGITLTSTTTGVGKTYTLTDATGSLTMFVRDVANITVNTNGHSVTGYVSIYISGTSDATQIGIRSASDIQ